jgi:hypothetical protein
MGLIARFKEKRARLRAVREAELAQQEEKDKQVRSLYYLARRLLPSRTGSKEYDRAEFSRTIDGRDYRISAQKESGDRHLGSRDSLTINTPDFWASIYVDKDFGEWVYSIDVRPPETRLERIRTALYRLAE